jgi:hypothetical protein
MEDTSLKDRFTELLNALDIAQGAFERKCLLANGAINSIKDSVTSKTLLKIHKVYPSVNMDWIITGRGSMFTTESSCEEREIVSPVAEALLKTIDSQQREIRKYKNDSNWLESEIKKAKKELEECKKRLPAELK